VGTNGLEFQKFYQNMITEAEDWHEVNGWGSRRSQYRRYTAAYEALDIRQGDCLVDVGCGTGDFSQFVWEKGVDICYHGFDVMQEMVDLAKQKHGDKFRLWDIYSSALDVRSDWTIAIGTIGALATQDEDERWMNLTKMVQNIAATSDKGFVFTMLTNRNPHVVGDKHHWFVDASEAIGKVLEMIPPTMLLTIKMDYHPHEMMFAVKNQDF
jgi:cyclopropane fatty-acyl-phospholipid synthase-like methyltransferase